MQTIGVQLVRHVAPRTRMIPRSEPRLPRHGQQVRTHCIDVSYSRFRGSVEMVRERILELQRAAMGAREVVRHEGLRAEHIREILKEEGFPVGKRFGSSKIFWSAQNSLVNVRVSVIYGDQR